MTLLSAVAHIPIRDEILVPLPVVQDVPQATQALDISPWLILVILLGTLFGATLLFYRGSFRPPKTTPNLDSIDMIDSDGSLKTKISKS